MLIRWVAKLKIYDNERIQNCFTLCVGWILIACFSFFFHLHSKDPELEGSLQNSLRENLKEIGQRCIHELREFIEKLKSQRAGSK